MNTSPLQSNSPTYVGIDISKDALDVSLAGLPPSRFGTDATGVSKLVKELRKQTGTVHVNQTIYTTHSPFLVGPDELDLVRVVEMVDRTVGTKIHTEVTSDDPAALLPLQEALGYDLAQSLFSQQRNLVLEGLTDYWYIDSIGQLLREAGIADLNDKIALVPAQSAGKVVYFATILYAHKLKVAALLDSDNAGDQAARQDILVILNFQSEMKVYESPFLVTFVEIWKVESKSMVYFYFSYSEYKGGQIVTLQEIKLKNGGGGLEIRAKTPRFVSIFEEEKLIGTFDTGTLSWGSEVPR